MESTQMHPTTRSVRNIMSSKLFTVDMDDSLRTAMVLFERERFHHVIVMDHGQVQGVVSDRDILKVVSPFLGHPSMERAQDAGTAKKRVHQIMTRKPVTVRPDQSVAEAADLMLSQRVSCLPVVDEWERLVGIVTVRDLLGQLASIQAAS